jgi:hypothetical protein
MDNSEALLGLRLRSQPDLPSQWTRRVFQTSAILVVWTKLGIQEKTRPVGSHFRRRMPILGYIRSWPRRLGGAHEGSAEAGDSGHQTVARFGGTIELSRDRHQAKVGRGEKRLGTSGSHRL